MTRVEVRGRKRIKVVEINLGIARLPGGLAPGRDVIGAIKRTKVPPLPRLEPRGAGLDLAA